MNGPSCSRDGSSAALGTLALIGILFGCATGRVRTAIDGFILAKLEAVGLTLSPDANRETLVRRVAVDLTGLPPSAEEVDAFLADANPDAYERLVDRLLASPHYGERWGRHW